jgi:NitT/TauT family transport system ATP-binding protein
VLLLDEPLSALDAQTRDLLMEDFETLWKKEQTTALYVTHNLNEAIRLADRIALLSRRPGTLREIVDVSASRDKANGKPDAARLQAHLWDLIREEAAVADREVSHA